MKCPRCDQRLQNATINDLEIAECGDCGGAWFSEDQLRMLKDRTDPDLNWMDFELWDHPDRFRVSAKPAHCPSCEQALFGINYGATPIEVDYCTACDGVWLDPGEFESIVTALTDELLTKEVPDYIRASLTEAREVIAGPESPLSEWRDLLTVMRMFQYRVLSENPRVSKALADIQTLNPLR